MKAKSFMLAGAILLTSVAQAAPANRNAVTRSTLGHSFSFYAETLFDMLYPQGLIAIKNTTGYPRTPPVFYVQPGS